MAIHNVFAFSALYIIILIFFSLALVFFNPEMGFTNGFMLSLASLTNTGVMFTPQQASMDILSLNLGIPEKILLSLEMLTGRLEIYAILIMFIPDFWHKD